MLKYLIKVTSIHKSNIFLRKEDRLFKKTVGLEINWNYWTSGELFWKLRIKSNSWTRFWKRYSIYRIKPIFTLKHEEDIFVRSPRRGNIDQPVSRARINEKLSFLHSRFKLRDKKRTIIGKLKDKMSNTDLYFKLRIIFVLLIWYSKYICNMITQLSNFDCNTVDIP